MHSKEIDSGRPLNVKLGRCRDFRSERPRDDQTGRIEDILGTLEEAVLEMSWGPIFA